MLNLVEKPTITYQINVEDADWWHEITTTHVFGGGEPRKSGDATFNLTVSDYTFKRRVEADTNAWWYLKYKDVFDKLAALEFDYVNFQFYDEVLYRKTRKKFAKKWDIAK